MAMQRVNGIPTIDVALVVVRTDEVEYAIDTSSKVAVEPQTETTDAIKLIKQSSGNLLAQKPQTVTVTGHAITWTDNVFIPAVVVILQGGTYEEVDGNMTYIPPVSGSNDKGKIFEMDLYSTIYDGSGQITGYEKITYPNCQGIPITINMEDNVFRIPEYTINSAPKTGEAPYVMTWVKELPVFEDVQIGGEDNVSGVSEANSPYTLSRFGENELEV